MDRTTVKASVNFLEVAAEMAHLGAGEQADFFNEFSKELMHGCTTQFLFERQGLFIRGKLTPTAKELFETLSYKPEDPDPII